MILRVLMLIDMVVIVLMMRDVLVLLVLMMVMKSPDGRFLTPMLSFSSSSFASCWKLAQNSPGLTGYSSSMRRW